MITPAPAVRYILDGRTVFDLCTTLEGAQTFALPNLLANGYSDAAIVTVNATPLPCACGTEHTIACDKRTEDAVYTIECDVCGEDCGGIVEVAGEMLACPDCRAARNLATV